MDQRACVLLLILFSLQGCGTSKTDSSGSSNPFDEEFQQEEVLSRDLDADRKAMWRTVPSNSSDFEVSPVSAINAASRLFASVKLEGKTKDEVEQVIGYQPRPRYGYNLPFYPGEKGTVVYRFDCGNFGWQFTLRFDSQGRLASVQRQGIE